jgi:hypothetical protein
MSDLCSTVGSGLENYFEKMSAKLHKWVDPLSHEQFWRNPYPYGNDIGHLVLHLTGNLNYYIGAQIAGSGYIRDRDREFSEPRRPAKQEVLQEFDRAISLVRKTIREQSAEQWAADYSAERSTAKNRFAMVLDCAAHIDHHVGQIIYLSKECAAEAGPRAVSS